MKIQIIFSERKQILNTHWRNERILVQNLKYICEYLVFRNSWSNYTQIEDIAKQQPWYPKNSNCLEEQTLMLLLDNGEFYKETIKIDPIIDEVLAVNAIVDLDYDQIENNSIKLFKLQ